MDTQFKPGQYFDTVKLEIFKPSTKWYKTQELIIPEWGPTVKDTIIDYFRLQSYNALETNWFAICINSNHPHNHPIMFKGPIKVNEERAFEFDNIMKRLNQQCYDMFMAERSNNFYYTDGSKKKHDNLHLKTINELRTHLRMNKDNNNA